MNPNYPHIRCIDGTDPLTGEWTCAEDIGAGNPYRVFDIAAQAYTGPEFQTREEAMAYMETLGGATA